MPKRHDPGEMFEHLEIVRRGFRETKSRVEPDLAAGHARRLGDRKAQPQVEQSDRTRNLRSPGRAGCASGWPDSAAQPQPLPSASAADRRAAPRVAGPPLRSAAPPPSSHAGRPRCRSQCPRPPRPPAPQPTPCKYRSRPAHPGMPFEPPTGRAARDRIPPPRSPEAAPGRVDSPPMSSTSAPAASIAPARSTAAWGVGSWPPSENESGVMFRTPMTSVRPPGAGSGRPCGLCQIPSCIAL